MLLNHLSLDFAETEDRISRLLSVATEPNDDVQTACRYFEGILSCVFASLEKGHRWKRWGLDDLWCEHLSRRENVVTLQGTPYWLTGGDDCSEFKVDVALDTHPLLYSYKFTHRKKGKQVLYVGKTPDGWLLNGA